LRPIHNHRRELQTCQCCLTLERPTQRESTRRFGVEVLRPHEFVFINDIVVVVTGGKFPDTGLGLCRLRRLEVAVVVARRNLPNTLLLDIRYIITGL
jgi:hypothetical protein